MITPGPSPAQTRQGGTRWSASASSAGSGPTGWRSTASGTPTVWPEMLDALRAAGWTNYSLFLTGDGLLVGYLETDDYAAALGADGGHRVNGRWQAEMAPFFADLGGLPPDQGFRRIDRDLPPRLTAPC